MHISSNTPDQNAPLEAETDTVELYQFAIVNIVPVDGGPEDSSGILASVLDPNPNENNEILVQDIDKQEYFIPLERIAVYRPHEVLVMLNRYNMINDVMRGVVDPAV